VHEPITTAICAIPGAHVGLVEEDPAEMIPVGKHLVLVGQVGAARIHQIDAGQIVLERDLLGAEMLLHRQRVIGPALHRGVVAHHHHVAAPDPADPRDHARAGNVSTVKIMGGEPPDLEKRRIRIEQCRHPVARQQLAAPDMTLPRGLRSAQPVQFGRRRRLRDLRLHPCRVVLEDLRAGGDF
jgi:hypothetical protein